MEGNSSRTTSPVVLTILPHGWPQWDQWLPGACGGPALCRPHQRPSADCSRQYQGPVEVDPASFELLLQRSRQRVRIHLEARGERNLRRDATPHATTLLTGDSFVKLQCVTPKSLASERVVTEYLLSLVEQCL